MTGVDRRTVVGAGIVLVLATALVSGVSTFVNTYAVRGTGSDAFVTVRNLMVAAMLVPLAGAVAWSRPDRSRLRRSEIGWLAVVGLLGGAVPFLLFFHGIALAGRPGATTASFVYRTLFLFAGVFALVALRERLRWRYFGGAALLLAGAYLLLSLGSPVWTDGTPYVLAATVLWAAEYTVSKRLLLGLRSSTVALGRMGFGGLFLAAYLGVTAQWSSVSGFGTGTWTWLAISAVLLTAFVATWYSGLRRVDLSVASALLVVGYPVTWGLSILFGGGTFSFEDAAGVLAILAGAGLVVGLVYLRSSWAWVAGVRSGESARA